MWESFIRIIIITMILMTLSIAVLKISILYWNVSYETPTAGSLIQVTKGEGKTWQE